MAEVERRFQSTSLDLAVTDKQLRVMHGEAAVTGKWSTGCGWFEERMNGGCFDEVTKRSGLECYSLFNHERSKVLGVTTNGELRLGVNSKGNLEQDTDLKGDTNDSRDMIAHLEAKRITRMSFAFMVTKRDHEKWTDEGGILRREVLVVDELFDVSPVTYAAYNEANVTIRGVVPGKDPEIDEVIKTLIRCERSLSVGATELANLRDFHLRLGKYLASSPAQERKAEPAIVSLESLKSQFEGLL